MFGGSLTCSCTRLLRAAEDLEAPPIRRAFWMAPM